MSTERKYGIVLIGATGFTGQLIAQYLRQRVSGAWAIAGRNKKRLEEIKATLFSETCDVLTCDTTDQKSVDRVVEQTRVVINAAGPFSLYGTPVVDACVRFNTHYTDITGESPWVRTLIDKYHDRAKENKTRIVPMCGFDSIPSDLGTFLVAEHARTELKQALRSVDAVVSVTGGGASGGTLNTIMTMMESPLKEQKKASGPFLLNPGGVRNPHLTDAKQQTVRWADQDSFFISKNKTLKCWTMPWVMSLPNSRVVRRSNALYQLAGRGYGDIAYTEKFRSPTIFHAFIGWALLLAFVMMLVIRPTRWVLRRVLPKPGEGPSAAQRAKARFSVHVVGQTEDKRIVRGIVSGGDPGYTDTAKMVSESALCLLEDEPTDIGAAGGVLTSASAMGANLVTRLRAAGMRFEVEKEADKK